MEPFGKLIDAYNRTGVDFVFTELDTARTFLQTAATTQIEESRLRNKENAQIAFETAMRYAQRIKLMGAEKERFDTVLAEVKSMLLDAGIAL